jgi:CotH kinase protein/Bacterial Ig-like domain (group 3)
MNHKFLATFPYFARAILSSAVLGTTGCNVVTKPSLTITPQSLTIHPGDQNVPVTVSLNNGNFIGSVPITVEGLPSGITVSALTLSPGQSGTLQFSASLSADQVAFPAANPADANTDVKSLIIGSALGPNLASSPMSLTVSLSNPTYLPDANKINLPLVKIDTNGTPIIDKTTEVSGTITVTSADGQTSYLPNGSDKDNSATFHVHGQTTSGMPKKPYHVKLNTSLDLLNTMGLSCPYITSSGKKACDKSKSYILLANYDDKTLLRYWAASALANAIPIGNGYLDSPANSPSPSGTNSLMPWAPHSLFVELYLNGEYEGSYQLVEEIKVDSHRVNINELSESDADPAELTGGYLLEIDQRQQEDFVFSTPQGVPIGLVDPDFSPDPEVPQQTSYVSSYVGAAESALFAGNFTDPTLGWRAYFDEASAVNYYIVNDVMGNSDGGAFFSSDYLYKGKDNSLLYMGPVWDFDISAGNVNYTAIVNPTVPWMQTQAVWYRRWFQDPGFKADLTTQWNALKSNGVFDQWIASINQEAAALQQSQANNFLRWPILGIKVWPNPEAAGSYSGEIAYLTSWLNLRIAYLDSQFNQRAQTSTLLSIPSGTLQNGTPVTLTAQVTGTGVLSGTVSFMSSGLILGTGTLDSSGLASLTTSNLPTGNALLQAVYSGDGTNGLSASSVINVTVVGQLVTGN